MFLKILYLVSLYLSTVVIPTTPWESLWHGVAQWFGIINPTDLDEILPNKNSFPEGDMFTTVELYGYSPPPVTPSPTSAPSPGKPTAPPSTTPTAVPSTSPSCGEDPTALVTYLNTKNVVVTKTCDFLSTRPNGAKTACASDGVNGGPRVSEVCLKTCGTCYLLHPSSTPSAKPTAVVPPTKAPTESPSDDPSKGPTNSPASAAPTVWIGEDDYQLDW